MQYELVRRIATKTLLDNLYSRVSKCISEQFSRQLRSQASAIKYESAELFKRRLENFKLAKSTIGRSSLKTNSDGQDKNNPENFQQLQVN